MTNVKHHESEIPSRLEELIDAIVDGTAQNEHWDEFRTLAGQSTEPWRRLAEEQRMMATLQKGFDAQVCAAMTVELPAPQGAERSRRWSMTSWRPALGWAAALVMGVVWAGSTLLPQTPTVPPAQETLLVQYLAQPHVVGELPIEIRDVARTESGEVVTYIRPIVERRSVDLYNIQLDENSNPVLREATDQPVLLASRY